MTRLHQFESVPKVKDMVNVIMDDSLDLFGTREYMKSVYMK